MLLFISDQRRVKESLLTQIVRNYDQSVKVANLLLDCGFVTNAVEISGHTTTWWSITDSGEKAAELLRAVKKLENGESPEPENNSNGTSAEIRDPAKP